MAPTRRDPASAISGDSGHRRRSAAPLPFGVAIVVPLLLTLAVAWLARGVLRDLRRPCPWADVGGALWLLQPLGTESGLWPAALHVPLGLALALAAIRLYRRGRLGWAAAANLAAALSVEQVILPLPLAAWLVAPAGERRRAAGVSLVMAAMVVATFLLWPGANPRLRVGIARADDRARGQSCVLRRVPCGRSGPAFDPARDLVGVCRGARSC